jgi:hypothetical protein
MKVNNIEINEMPTVDYLNECFRCDEEFGKLYWKVRPDYHFETPRGAINFNSRFANKELGSLNDKGYLTVKLDKVLLRVHRIIWKIINKVEPEYFIDHIDGNRSNNIITNLRDVDHRSNNRNITTVSKNKSQKIENEYLGVYYIERTGNWTSAINFQNKKIHLGRFITKEEAALAYQLKRIELYGEEFCNASNDNKILLENLKIKVKDILENRKEYEGKPKIRSTVTNKLGYNGVEQVGGGKFRAVATKDGVKYPCGRFDTVEEAALAFEYKLIELYGIEFYLYSDRGLILEDLEEKVKLLKELN